MEKQVSIPGNITFPAIISWIFGIIAVAIGLVNTFWGNDAVFGIFIQLAALAFFPPVTDFVTRKTGIVIPGILKVVLALFIVWAALGVGELFSKVELMLSSFQ